jgi:multidrug efflux pump subunit AcrA (membrane-fusion protein)
MKKIMLVLLLVVLALVTVLTVYLVRTARPPGAMTVIESQAMDMSSMKAPEGVLPVSVEAVRREPLSAGLTYTGSVVAFSDEDVVARVSGRVLSIPVYPGQRVDPGQVVVELDAVELGDRTEALRAGAQRGQAQVEAALAEATAARRSEEAAEAERRSARVRVEQARAEVVAAQANASFREQALARDRELYDQGGLSLEELQRSEAETEEVRTELRNAKLGVNQASEDASAAASRGQSQVALHGAALAKAQAGQAEARQARAEARAAGTVQDYTRVTSLEGGEVTERLVSPGTLVMPGTLLLRIKRTDRLRLQARVPSQQAARMRDGDPVRVQPSGERRAFPARVTSIFGAADPVSRTVTVEALIPNSDGRLKPGEYVEMTISVGGTRPQLTIPRTALHRDLDGKSFVFGVRSQNGEQKGAYTCVMHPEVRSDRPGQCPKCGMDLVPVESRGDLVAEKVEVEPGPASGDRQAIASGLSEGDEVIVNAPDGLRAGMGVKAVPWGEDGPTELPSPAPRVSDAPSPAHQGHTPTPSGHEGHGR